jgi:hypothetical protein
MYNPSIAAAVMPAAALRWLDEPLIINHRKSNCRNRILTVCLRAS